MRKVSKAGAFNDGEVVIQRGASSSKCLNMSLSEEQENTEEVTVMVSPVKPKASAGAAGFKGLGKCSRVFMKAGSQEDDSDSDGEKGNDCDVSTFIRPTKKVAAAVLRTTRSTISATSTVPDAKVQLESAAKTSQMKVDSNKSKNFVMNSEMKNFDPVEWKKVRAIQMPSHSQCAVKVVDEEVHLSVSALPAALSPIMSGGELSRDSSEDESEEMETCPLDLSICETKVLVPQRTSSRIQPSQSADRDAVKGQVASKSQPTVVASSSSSATATHTRGGTQAVSSPDASAKESQGEENCSKRRKRVSFAGNPGPDKRSKEATDVASHLSSLSNVKQEKIVTLTLKDKTYTRLNVLGKGGSSCVYRVMSQTNSQLYAYKRVEVKGSTEDNEALFDSYINEIELLRRLKGTSPYIIDLVDAEVDREGMYIAIVMEAGEVDLAKVLSQKLRQAVPPQMPAAPGASGHAYTPSVSPPTLLESEGKELLNPFFMRMVWQEMLEAVDHIHSHRIVHGDLKPANFVFVKGHLKLIDFGIAKAFSNDTTNIYRESQIGTVNYMAPEAIAPYSVESGENEHEGMSMRLGRASDIWSLGCILYQMLYGRPPFAALTTIQKLHAIPNPKYAIQYPEEKGHSVDWDAVGTIQACLERDPRKRAMIRGEGGLLSLPYLSVKAMRRPCDLSFAQGEGGKVSVSRDQVRSAVQLAVKSLQGQRAELNQSQEAQLFNELWRALSDGQGSGSGIAETSVQTSKPVPSRTTANTRPDSPTDITPRLNVTVEGTSNSNVQQVGAVGAPVVSSFVCQGASSGALPLRSAPTFKIPPDNKINNPTASLAAPIVPSQATRQALVNAAMEAARKRSAASAAAAAAVQPGSETMKTSTQINTTARAPLRAMPPSLQEQILKGQRALENVSVNSNGQRDRWMRPKGQSPERQDLKSVIEKRIGAMRKFLDEEQDLYVTGTVDFMDANSFF